jgi:LCP family protein required for cell wall assembly
MNTKLFPIAILLVSSLFLSSCSNIAVPSLSHAGSASASPAVVENQSTPNPTPQPTDQVGNETNDGIINLPTNTLINRYPRPEGQVNLLILGSDFRPDAGYRTDVIMLLSVNTLKNTASLISFPRDLYVEIPGWETQRLNTAQQHGGFELTQKTFELNFGVHPDHYIMTNFEGFRSIIDTLGGVDVQAAKPLSDKCDLPKTATLKEVDGYCNVDIGTVHLDADSALWYSRARYSTDDFDRTRRAQEVVRAIFEKMISLQGLTKAPELYQALKNNVETDLSLADMLKFIPLATKLKDLNGLKQYRIDRNYVDGWITPDGADVQLPHTEQIFTEIIAKACYGQ